MNKYDFNTYSPINNILDALKNIRKIIADYVGLDTEHCYIYNQTFKIPDDDKLCVVVGTLGDKTYYAGSSHKDIEEEYKEINSVKAQGKIRIHIFSYDFSALEYKNKVISALSSDFCLNQQYLHNYHIGKNPTAIKNISQKDGAKILNRYILEYNIIYQSISIQESSAIEILNTNFYIDE